MSDAEPLFTILRQSADADAVAAIERLVRDAPDRALNRINVLDFAATRGSRSGSFACRRVMAIASRVT